MHEFFTKPELLYLVVQEIDTREKSTLLALALTCRLFKDIAQARLWMELESFQPLVSQLPSDLIETEYTEDGELTFVELKREMTPSDWEIYHRFAGRVRSIVIGGMPIGEEKPVGIDEQILNTMNLYRPAQSLLPRLDSLVFNCLPDNDFVPQHIQTLLGSTVKRFSVEVNSCFDSLPSKLVSLSRLCPHLTHFSLDWRTIWENADTSNSDEVELVQYFLKGIPRILQDLRALKVLELLPGPLDAVVLHQVSQLEMLQSLRGSFHKDPLFLPYDQEIQLTQLQEVDIHGTSWADTCTLLKSVRRGSIRTVTIQSDEENPDFQECTPWEVLNILTEMSSLEDVDVYGIQAFPPIEADVPFEPHLGQLKNVKTFCYVSSSARLFHNGCLQQMSTWSCLSSLRVYSDRHDAAFIPKMDLEGLVPVLTQCPNLRIIDISVLCRGFDLAKLSQSTLAPVRSVYFVESPITDYPSVIVDCLQAMFPDAETVYGEYLPDKDTWREINESLKSSRNASL